AARRRVPQAERGGGARCPCTARRASRDAAATRRAAWRSRGLGPRERRRLRRGRRAGGTARNAIDGVLGEARLLTELECQEHAGNERILEKEPAQREAGGEARNGCCGRGRFRRAIRGALEGPEFV